MRILLLSRCPPFPLHLGDRLIIWHLSRELQQRGHQIDLLAFAQLDSDWHEMDEYRHLFAHVQLVQETRRTPRHFLSRMLQPQRRFPERAALAWSPPMWRELERHLHETSYDVVHLFGSVQVYEYAHLLEDMPAIITPYESFSLYLQRAIAQDGGWMNRVQQFVAAQMESWMFAPYARTVVVAQPDKDELLRLAPQLPVDVISNGIDLHFFTGGGDERDEATLLFVGNYEYPPNVDAALLLATQILPAVRDVIPQARLQLVGNAPPPQLQALANEHIDVTGRVPDVRPYLATCTAFVCPLRMGAGIKNKVLEALAMGAPVIASPLSVDGIAVQDGQHALAVPVATIADETIRLLQDRSLQHRLSQQGRELIEKRYSWSSIAEQYLALYHAIR